MCSENASGPRVKHTIQHLTRVPFLSHPLFFLILFSSLSHEVIPESGVDELANVIQLYL